MCREDSRETNTLVVCAERERGRERLAPRALSPMLAMHVLAHTLHSVWDLGRDKGSGL